MLFQGIWRMVAADGDATNELRFLNEAKLAKHFKDHGAKLGYKNIMDYLNGARNLIKGGKGIEIFTRSNGEKLFFNPKTGEFMSLSSDGRTIKTYFIPRGNPANYWKTEAGKY